MDNGHVQDHSFPHSLRHAVGDSTLCVGLAAIGVRQAIKTVECRLLDSAAILDAAEALNLLEISVVSSVDGDESGDDRELLGAAHLITCTSAVKIFSPRA